MTDHPFVFPKQEHLCSERDITQLFEKGESFISYPMRVVWLKFPIVEGSPVKVVMTVPKKKLKRAVDRNRIKRLLREAYRLNKQALIQQAVSQGVSLHIAFIWVPAEKLEYKKVEKKMKDALLKVLSNLLPPKTSDETKIE
jgi:ribonuclease P protein component